MSDKSSAELSPLVSRNRYDAQVSFALRQFVGRGKRYSSARVLEGPSGVAWRAIEAARTAPDDPEHRHLPVEKLLSISGVLGPEFTSLWMAPLTQQGAYWLPEGDGDAAKLNTDCAEFNFAHAKATSPDSPGGAEILPIERKALVGIASRIAPRACTVAAA